MPIFALQIKAYLNNVTSLQPSDYLTHRWYLKIKCSSCGEVTNCWQYATIAESYDLTKGHGTCHILIKCSFCSRKNTLEILKDSYLPYSEENNGQFQTIVKFDCRGLEPIDFDFRIGWECSGIKSDMVFNNIDLTSGEWVDYDEKINEPTEITEIEKRFILLKK